MLVFDTTWNTGVTEMSKTFILPFEDPSLIGQYFSLFCSIYDNSQYSNKFCGVKLEYFMDCESGIRTGSLKSW